MIAALVSAALIASCTPDSVPQPRSLFSWLPIKAFHFDEAGGTAPINGKSDEIAEFRVSLASCRWPAYTLTAVSSFHTHAMRTKNVLLGTATYDRWLYVNTSGWELERRWRDSSIFHPMVSFAIGSLRAENRYSRRLPAGTWDRQTDPPTTTTYYAPAVGIEASVFKYMTMYALVGSRFAGSIEMPGLQPGAFNGSYSVFGMGFGRFR